MLYKGGALGSSWLSSFAFRVSKLAPTGYYWLLLVICLLGKTFILDDLLTSGISFILLTTLAPTFYNYTPYIYFVPSLTSLHNGLHQNQRRPSTHQRLQTHDQRGRIPAPMGPTHGRHSQANPTDSRCAIPILRRPWLTSDISYARRTKLTVDFMLFRWRTSPELQPGFESMISRPALAQHETVNHKLRL